MSKNHVLPGADNAGDMVACVALEECRLRCEQLSEAGYGSAPLQAVHRDIGLAGYHASARLTQSARHEALAEAISRAGTLTGSAREAELVLGRTAENAARSIRHAARGCVHADHLHTAQEHLTGARRVLRAPILPKDAERHARRRPSQLRDHRGRQNRS